jgi:hypothetical protein
MAGHSKAGGSRWCSFGFEALARLRWWTDHAGWRPRFWVVLGGTNYPDLSVSLEQFLFSPSLNREGLSCSFLVRSLFSHRLIELVR